VAGRRNPVPLIPSQELFSRTVGGGRPNGDVPLSPSSITWYRPKGGDALLLGR